MRRARPLLCLLLWLAPLGESSAKNEAPTLALDEQQARQWHRFWEEQEALLYLVELSQRIAGERRRYLLHGATLIPMSGQGTIPDGALAIENGRITYAGPAQKFDQATGFERIDASGQFLIPGLTESHAHTISSPSQFLVYLTRGVTTLREMDGFPWMLRARAGARSGEWLIPNLYVAGHILSHRPFDFYMTGVDSPEQARQLVRTQASAGYDSIKIHNSMPEPLFEAIFEEARAVGLDVVGHIPHEIAVADAIAAGMHTNEHFKGYLYDPTLEITDQDYVAATRGSSLWNTPTFTTYHDHQRGEEASALAEREGSLALVPSWLRASWRRNADQPLDDLTRLRQTIYPKSRQIFTRLRPVTDRFLAGTDTGTYGYLVPGYALQEEVRIFESLGMSPFEALETATIHPARALRAESEFGTLEPGMRADFVLLDGDPLEGTDRLAKIAGVAVRGVWLDAELLREVRTRLAEIFAGGDQIPEPRRPAIESLVRKAERLVASGWPYPDYILEGIEDWLQGLDQLDLAADVRRLRAGHRVGAGDG